MPPHAAELRTRFRYRAASVLRRHEGTWLALVSTRRVYRQCLVRRSTDILIDGYFRSANTFSVEAFLSVNPGAKVSQHLHSPFQFVRAGRFGVPAILLIRQPDDAVASELVRAPEKTADEAWRDWIFFYESARQHSRFFVVATFDQVISDFSPVVQSVNRLFDRDFVPYHNSSIADAVVFEAVDRYFREGKGQLFSAEKFAQVVGRPNPARREEPRAVRLRGPRYPTESTRRRANDLYSHFLDVAQRQRAVL